MQWCSLGVGARGHVPWAGWVRFFFGEGRGIFKVDILIIYLENMPGFGMTANSPRGYRFPISSNVNTTGPSKHASDKQTWNPGDCLEKILIRLDPSPPPCLSRFDAAADSYLYGVAVSQG